MKCPKCSIPISEHPANQCLDSLYAEKVMGWKLTNDVQFLLHHTDWSPSTNIGCAMQGVEKANRPMALHRVDKDEWRCVLNVDLWKNLLAEAKTAALAITRALVLWAMGEKGK